MPAAFSYANVDNGMDCESVLSVMQGKTIKGQILDATGESMIGVSVLVKGTTIGDVYKRQPYIRITSAHDAYDFVLKNAGANIPCRDIVDERIIDRCV